MGPIVGGRAEVRTDVAAEWSGTDAHGRLTGYRSSEHAWVFQTRDDGGWRVSAVTAPAWCGGYVRIDACRR